MIKVCPNTLCGKPVEDLEGKFCPNCGYVLVEIFTTTEAERLQQFAEVVRGRGVVQQRALPEPAQQVIEPVPVMVDEEVVPPEAPSKPVITEVIDVVPKKDEAPKPESKVVFLQVVDQSLFGTVTPATPLGEALAKAALDHTSPKRFAPPVPEPKEPSPPLADPQTVRTSRRRISFGWIMALSIGIGTVLGLLVWHFLIKPQQEPVAQAKPVVEEVAPAAPKTDGEAPPPAATVTAEDPTARDIGRKAAATADQAITGLGNVDRRVKTLENQETRGIVIGAIEAAPAVACEFRACVEDLLQRGDQRLVKEGIITHAQARESAERTCRTTGCP